MLKTYVPKFKIDDIIFLNDEFSSNPVDKIIFIGQVQSIYIKRGLGLFKREGNKGIFYDIKNYSLGKIPEKRLKLYEGQLTCEE